MTNYNERLDEVLQGFAMAEQQIGDELAVGAIQEETFDTRDTLARDKAKQAILDWHNKQIERLLDEMLVDVSSPSANIDQVEMIELINFYIYKLKESTDEYSD